MGSDSLRTSTVRNGWGWRRVNFEAGRGQQWQAWREETDHKRIGATRYSVYEKRRRSKGLWRAGCAFEAHTNETDIGSMCLGK